MTEHWPRTYGDVPEAFVGAEISPAMAGRTAGQSMILITGPAGTGKSHQLWALYRSMANRDVRAGDHAGMLVISECMDVAAHRWDDDWLEAMCRFPGVLAVDDLGYRCHAGQMPNEWLQHAAYCVSEYRTAMRLRLLVTTNLTRARLTETYGPAVASRLWSGAVIETDGQDRRIER